MVQLCLHTGMSDESQLALHPGLYTALIDSSPAQSTSVDVTDKWGKQNGCCKLAPSLEIPVAWCC